MSLVNLLARTLQNAARKAAADPENRAKAQAFVDQEVRPRAEEAWKEARPKVEETVRKVRDQLKDSALPASDLKGFAAKVRSEFNKGLKGE